MANLEYSTAPAWEHLQNRPGFKQTGERFVFCCPAHDDHHASASGRIVSDRLLVECHTRCTFKEIAAAMGLRESDFFVPKIQTKATSAKPSKHLPPVVTEFKIVDPYTYELCGIQGRKDYLCEDGSTYQSKDVWFRSHNGRKKVNMPL